MRLLVSIFLTSLFFIKISALRIKIGKYIDKYISINWENEINSKFGRIDKSKVIDSNLDREGPFILADLEYEDGIFTSVVYNNGDKISYKPDEDGKWQKIELKIDFINENPSYKLNFYSCEKKGDIFSTNLISLDDPNILEEKAKYLLKCEGEVKDDNKKNRLDVVKNLLLVISKTGIIEQNNKWALFKISVEGCDGSRYFYCNNIESIDDLGGVFLNKITSVTVVKSNATSVRSLCCLFADCYLLESVNLENLVINKNVSLEQMFHGCRKLKYIKFPNSIKLKTSNLNSTFYNCESLENVNLNDIELENVNTLSSLFNNCRKLKKVKFPKVEIKKNTKLINHFYDGYHGPFTGSEIDELDMTQVKFEKDAGKDMFSGTKIKKIILPESMNKLRPEHLSSIFDNITLESCKIGKYEIKIKEYDNVINFIQSPAEYIEFEPERIKEYNFLKCNGNIDVPKVGGCCCCANCNCCKGHGG